MTAFEKLSENPQSVKFEEKVGNAKGIYTMRVEGGNQVAFTKNLDGNFVPYSSEITEITINFWIDQKVN